MNKNDLIKKKKKVITLDNPYFNLVWPRKLCVNPSIGSLSLQSWMKAIWASPDSNQLWLVFFLFQNTRDCLQ